MVTSFTEHGGAHLQSQQTKIGTQDQQRLYYSVRASLKKQHKNPTTKRKGELAVPLNPQTYTRISIRVDGLLKVKGHRLGRCAQDFCLLLHQRDSFLPIPTPLVYIIENNYVFPHSDIHYVLSTRQNM